MHKTSVQLFKGQNAISMTAAQAVVHARRVEEIYSGYTVAKHENYGWSKAHECETDPSPETERGWACAVVVLFGWIKAVAS